MEVTPGTTGKASARGDASAGVRRARYASATVVLVVAVTAVAILAVVLGTRANIRWDATASREHTLSARTIGVLQSVKDPTWIVVCADLSHADPRARQQTGDLLDEFARTSSLVKVQRIDLATSTAATQVREVVKEISRRDEQQVTEQAVALEHIEAVAGQLSQTLAPLAETVGQIAKSLPEGDKNREAIDQQAAALRVSVKDLAACVERIRDARTKGPPSGPEATDRALPETDIAQQAAGPVLGAAAKACAQGAALLKALPESKAVTDAAKSLLLARDDAAKAADALKSLKPLEPLMISRLLAKQQSVLVFSAKGTAAVDFEALAPPAADGDQTQAPRSVFAGEELLGSAVASLNVAARPIIIFVHAERERLLDERGAATTYAEPALGRLLERLHLRKIDCAEWATALDPARPTLAGIDPGGRRPRVWFVFPAPARTNLDPKQGLSLAERGQRIGKLAEAVKSLVDGRDSFIISLEPSELPAVGEPDPMAQPLLTMGIKPDSGRPLVERVSSAKGPAISTYQTIRQNDSQQPIARALSGVSTVLHWAMPLTLDAPPPAGWKLEAVMSVAKSDEVWGESSWLGLRYANVRQPLQMLMPPPSVMPGRDPKSDNVDGPWTVVAAAERTGEPGQRPQRVLVVGSPSWYEDLYTQAAQEVNGRRVWLFPGNSELFESGMHWCAGLDELIAPSPRIRDIPRIVPMTEGTLALVRWTLIAGLPLLVLSAGLAVRVLRR